MSYFVIKKSGNQNKSIELKTSEPSKPYMAVKRSGTVGYLPLTTETSGAGIKIKKNNKNYKVVETYTTSIDSSSTYNSYYNTTSTSYYTQTGTNYVPYEYFSIVRRRHYDLREAIQSESLFLSITSKSILKIYRNKTSKCDYDTTAATGINQNTSKTSLVNIIDTVNNISIVNVFKNTTKNTSFYAGSSNYKYSVNVTTDIQQVDKIKRSFSTYNGHILTASLLTKRNTRPSAQYQTYSKATSYYTVSTTSQ